VSATEYPAQYVLSGDDIIQVYVVGELRMPDKAVLYTEQDRVALITLNRSRTGNVIDASLAQQLEDVCQEINLNDDIYIAVITGAGEKAFCVGSELEYLVQTGNSVAAALGKLDDSALRHKVACVIARIDRPVIAAVNGDALGQGFELALSCDVRIAADSARFGFPLVSAGLMPMDGGTQRLPRLIGKGKAIELILSGDIIDANEACNIGLVSRVVPQKELMATAMAFAQNAATKAPIALRYVKEAVNKGMDLTLEQGIRLEADLYFLIHTTADRTEGIRAFQEKRKAQFKGK
jgi:enoyl-CoA hydratase/carnithine racemase